MIYIPRCLVVTTIIAVELSRPSLPYSFFFMFFFFGEK